MTIDEKEFFREATLRICGSLDIEKALRNALLYIKEYMPADHLTLHVYDSGLGVIETIAWAEIDKVIPLSLKTVLPTELWELKKEYESQTIRMVPKMKEDPIAGPVCQDLARDQDASGIILKLTLEGEFLGALSICNKNMETYTGEQQRLLSLLNEPFSIALANCLRYREIQELKDRLADDNRYLQDELRRHISEEIIGADFGLKFVMEQVRQVAPLDSPVLLLGETGTGKEVIAAAIHNASGRREGPFIKVNCGAIPETLIDGELFGHEKGAFTGAVAKKRGRFERAHGGTIFLDEIGELPPDAQVRMLRVLQEKEIERVGGEGAIQVDIRIIAATHRDLSTMIKDGTFREDLYFRLGVFPITIPPLRDRKRDIPLLVQYFIRKKARDMKLIDIPNLSPGAMDRLNAYDWPGNVRELENAVERALIVEREGPLRFWEVTPSGRDRLAPSHKGGEIVELDVAIARHIRNALSLSGGKIEGKGGAAEILGVKPGTLRHRMRKLGVPFGKKAENSGVPTAKTIHR